MTARALFVHLASPDIVLSVAAGRLRYSAPAGRFTDADRAAIRTHKAELLRLLAANDGAPPLERPAVTRADVARAHPSIVASCRVADVLSHADDADMADLLDVEALEAFVDALLAQGLVAAVPVDPLARVAAELGDTAEELREYLARTAPRLLAWLRTEANAEQAIASLRARPQDGLVAVLMRAMHGQVRTPNARAKAEQNPTRGTAP